MIIAVIFCSLSPFITVLAFINFFVCRLVYGYLMIYAETHKPDLGGVFFISSLKHLQGCLFIYIVLMAGVLHHRGKQLGNTAFGPGWLASISLIYYGWAWYRFNKLRWETLPFEEVVADDENK